MTKLLRPFEAITRALSGEKYVTASSVILTIDYLKKQLGHHITLANDDIVSSMASSMQTDICNRKKMLDCQEVLYMPTFLDPRFKRRGFTDEYKYAGTKRKVGVAVGVLCEEKESPAIRSAPVQPSRPSDEVQVDILEDMWCEYDAGHEQLMAARRPQCSALIEVRQYVEHDPIGRKEDPLIYWKINQVAYPRLAKLAKRHLAIVDTSTPSERTFSTAGRIVSAARNRLTPKNVEMLVLA